MPVDKERKLHCLLQSHPYLMDEALVGVKPASEVVMDAGRIDLLFAKRGCHIIVELKRTVLKPCDLDQLCRYWTGLKEDGVKLAPTHYLVGKKPRREIAFQKLLEHAKGLPFRARIKYLLWDIPDRVIWDTMSGRYVEQTEERLRNRCYQSPFQMRF